MMHHIAPDGAHPVSGLLRPFPVAVPRTCGTPALAGGTLGATLQQMADGRWSQAQVLALLNVITPGQAHRVLAVDYTTRLNAIYGLDVTADEVRARFQQVRDGIPTPIAVTALIDATVGRFVWHGGTLHICCAYAPGAMCSRTPRGGDLGTEGTLDVWRICKHCLNQAYRAGLLNYSY